MRRLVLSAIALTSTVLGVAPAAAQVAVPPLPPDVAKTVEVLSPVVHPLCGDALLVSSIGIGVLPPAVRDVISPFTGTPFIVCGLVPAPGARRMECEVDAVVGSLVDQVAFAVLGGASPFAPPESARLVDSLLIVEDRLPPPLRDLRPVTLGAPLLLCNAIVAETPATPGPPPTASAPSTPGTSAPATVVPGFDQALPFLPLAPVAVPGLPAAVGGPAVVPATPTQPVARTGPLDTVTYPVFLAPLAVIAMIVVLGRGFLATPHDSRR